MSENKMIPIMVLMFIIAMVSLFFAIGGVRMHGQVLAGEAEFHSLLSKYYSANKTARDSAATGSKLNSQFIEIQQYPSDLTRLKLLGIGKILTGIYTLLLGILITLLILPPRLKEALQHV